MKLKTIFSIIALIFAMSAFGQRATFDLMFTAVNNGVYVHLDSIKVMNRTLGGDTVLYYPDTTLTINLTLGDSLLYIGYTTGYPAGVRYLNPESIQFHLFQNYPNPVEDQCNISMYIPEKGTIKIMITDIHGILMNSINRQVDAGYHYFMFVPGVENFYLLSVRWNGISQCIKILTTGSNSGQSCRLDYIGNGNNSQTLKESLLNNDLIMLESGILDTPASNETYAFQFATNLSCPGTPKVEYEGKTYNTIQIYSQCWMKENLNVGTMIPGVQNQVDNGIKEKYCYDNNPDNCIKYGGLYEWNEMMQYTTQPGEQGICPPGWHLPTDEEWKVLEGAVDRKYGIGDPEWDDCQICGYDAGANLKTTSGWYGNGNGTDLFGFSGQPSGFRGGIGGFFNYIGNDGYWWTSTEYNYAWKWYRNLDFSDSLIGRSNDERSYGISVRCLKDY